MILSKGLLQSRNTFLSAIKLHKFHSSYFHVLQSPKAQYKQINIALEPLVWNVIARLESTSIAKDTILHLPKETSTAVPLSDNLPDIPIPGNVGIEAVSTPVSQLPDIIAEAAVPLNKIGEPTLESIGLGSWFTPVGWLQRWLEFLHVQYELPWWGAIAVTVVIVRILLFPLVIKSQRNAVKMHNVMPKMLELQDAMNASRTSGNQIEALQASHKFALFMKDNKVNPMGGFLLPVIQAPIFLSFFLALKKMSNVPIQSMTTGGLFWFVDLTIPDQYYALPLITCATLWAILEIGVDTGKLQMSTSLGRYAKYGFKVIPIIIFPFMMNFPTGVCVYWVTTNFVSLGQVVFLKIPAVRKYFQIDMKVKHDKNELKKNNKGFIKDVKASISNMRIARDIQDRERLDQAAFQRAGRLPPAKTFKYNPTETNADEMPVKKKFSVK